MSGKRVMTRLMVSSARSSASLKPLEIKTLPSPARTVSYFWAPTSLSPLPNQVNRESNCSWVILTVSSKTELLHVLKIGREDECNGRLSGQDNKSVYQMWPDSLLIGTHRSTDFSSNCKIRDGATRTIPPNVSRSEEHTSELQSQSNL